MASFILTITSEDEDEFRRLIGKFAGVQEPAHAAKTHDLAQAQEEELNAEETELRAELIEQAAPTPAKRGRKPKAVAEAEAQQAVLEAPVKSEPAPAKVDLPAVQEAIKNAAGRVSIADIRGALLENFQVQSAAQLKPEKYAAAIEVLNGLGV